MSKAAASAASSSNPAEAALLASVRLAQEKPLQNRAAGLAALSTLLSTGTWAGAQVASNVHAGKVLVPLLRDGASFLNNFAAITTEEIAASFLPFYPALLVDAAHWAWLQKQGLAEPQQPLYVTLVRLTLHPLYKVRVPVLRMLATLLSSKSAHVAQLQALLLKTFQLLVNSKNAAALSAPNSPAIWSRSLITIATQPVPAIMPLALLLAHDPLLTNSEAKSWRSANNTFDALLTVWSSQQFAVSQEAVEASAAKKRKLRNVPLKERDVLRATVAAQFPAIQELLFSKQALLSAVGTLAPVPVVPAVAPGANAAAAAAAAAAALAAATAGTVTELDEQARTDRQRTTAVGLLLSLYRVFPALSLSTLTSPLLALLSHPDFAKLSEGDVAVFRTPEGTLCDFLAQGEFKAVVAENKNVKRAADWTAKDEELELRAAAQKKAAEAAAAAKKPAAASAGAAKGGASAKGAPGGAKAVPLTGAAKVEFELKQKLESQSALRAKLLAAKKQVEPLLGFFASLAERQGKLVHDSVLPSLLPHLYTLFGNEIVRPAALDAHRRLMVCLDHHVVLLGTRVALSVQALKLRGGLAFTEPNQRRLLARTLFELRQTARLRPFSAQTFLFVFPIVQATIAHSADAASNDEAPASSSNEGEDESNDEFKAHKGGAVKVKNLESKDDDEEDEEEGEDEDEDDEEKESKEDDEEEEEKTEEGKQQGESSQYAPDVSAGAVSASGANDVDKPLAPGLQLSLGSASEVLNIHCAPALHEQRMDASAEPFPVAPMYSSLLHILASINTLYKPSLAALVSLSSASGIRPEQTLPLLSHEGVLSPKENVRLNALQGCDELRCFAAAASDDRVAHVAHFELFTQRMWIACHDSKADVSEKAAAVWQHAELAIGPQYLPGLIALLTDEQAVTRTAVGSAIASAIQQHPAAAGQTLTSMMDLFVKSPDEVVNSNNLGLRQGTEYVLRWHTRSGVAQALAACTDSITSVDMLRELFDFFTAHGLRDASDRVWEDCLNAALRIINQHGKTYMDVLLPIFEGVLQRDHERNAARAAAASASRGGGKGKGASSASAASAYTPLSEEEEFANDRLREGVILSMGTLARHMDESSGDKLVSVVDSLVEALQTPSHSVQKSVSECLAPLMSFPSVSEQAGKWIDLLLLRLHTAEEYGVRKGAAFGLAGMIKGLKLAALKKYDLLAKLNAMVQDKQSAKARQGALFAYERLFFELGNRFEPYVGQILPHLLVCYGDSNLEVREATQDAAKMIMSHLTAFGIKVVLPLILKALEAKEWRTKLESIGLLSAMAYCSPTQLSACLPMIVPRLLEVMSDPNEKVQTASRAALRLIGSTIRNPEILTLAPVLLAALNDPTTHTKRALQDLMRTSFVHSVDPPSLALIIPILRTGLKSRTAITKKMSAQVVGSMCSLIGDVKDILPYASTLLKYLKTSLVDANMEVRAVTARALAALYKGIIEEQVEGFVDLREWLLDTLRSDDTTPTIRSGCAQGLAQLLAAQGLEPTSQLLPSLFVETKSDRAVVREGFYSVFGFLCESYGQQFSIFVADVLPVVVTGLADDIGLVRESALAAGQSLVLNFASSKTELLLPALEDGIINPDWRIRLSSVQLLGVMLLRLAGLSMRVVMGASNTQEEGDEEKQAASICTREQEAHIETVLGTDRRNRLISTVYLMRCDVVPAVADIAFRVWKSVVSNSPRMLTTILPVLMSLIISDLASTREDRQAAAGRTLGELVQKMGDYILAEIVPILQARLSSDDRFTRQGVCLGLSEVMASSRKGDLAAYMADLIPSVRDALCDSEELVRRAAGTCFQTLLRSLGRRAVDDIVPALLHTLDEEQGDVYKSQLVLEGMRVVLSINSADVLPFLIPALCGQGDAAAAGGKKQYLSLFHAKALAFLSGNFTKGFSRYVENVTIALIDGISRCAPEELAEMRVACASVVLCVSQDCVMQFCTVLEETSTSNKNPAVRGAVAHLISAFTSNTRTSFDSQIPLLLQILLRMFAESGDLLQAAWDALDAMLKSVPEEKQVKHISFVRSVIADISFDQYELKQKESLPGFCLKKGIAPLLPMFQHGLMHGSPAVRVESAEGLSDLVRLTSPAALSPFVIKMTGPLIRIVGDRFPAEVKSAILNTLYLLLVKCAVGLKPFLPQLQTTMIKALSDHSAVVRSRGGLALAELLTDPKRATTVLTELASTVSNEATAGPVKTSCLQAMVGICQNKAIAGNLAPKDVARMVNIGESLLDSEREPIRRECARLIAVNAPYLSEEELAELLNARLLRRQTSTWYEKDGVLSALQACVRTCGPKVEAARGAITQLAVSSLDDKHAGVQSAGILLVGELLLHASKTADLDSVAKLSSTLVPLFQSEVAQVRQDAISRFQLLGESGAEAAAASYDVIVPGLVSRAQDPNGMVRTAVVGACHALFQFHADFERAEKLLGTYHARAMRKNANDATALLLFVKKSVARATVKPVPDDLWASQRVGETMADPSAVAAASAADDGDDDDEDDDE